MLVAVICRACLFHIVLEGSETGRLVVVACRTHRQLTLAALREQHGGGRRSQDEEQRCKQHDQKCTEQLRDRENIWQVLQGGGEGSS